MKFAFIAKEASLGITRLCRAMSVSRSGFYAWHGRPPSAHDKEDGRLTLLVHDAHHKEGRDYYGSPRVHRSLKKQGEHVGGKRVVRLMQEDGLVGRQRRRFKNTTDRTTGCR